MIYKISVLFLFLSFFIDVSVNADTEEMKNQLNSEHSVIANTTVHPLLKKESRSPLLILDSFRNALKHGKKLEENIVALHTVITGELIGTALAWFILFSCAGWYGWYRMKRRGI